MDSNEWIISFEPLCNLSDSDAKIINNNDALTKIMNKACKFTDVNIKSILAKPILDVSKTQCKISPFDSLMPLGISYDDIYIYYCKHLFNPDVDIWHSFFIDNHGVPHRIISSAIINVVLDRSHYESHAEILRYSMIYCIFMFHYSNIMNISKYINVLVKSLNCSRVDDLHNATYIKILIGVLKTIGQKIINIHINNGKQTDISLDFSKILNDIQTLHSCISLLEKIILFIYSSSVMCAYHAKNSVWYFDNKLSCEMPIDISFNDCICYKMKLDKSKVSPYLQQLKDMMNAIIADKEILFNFDS